MSTQGPSPPKMRRTFLLTGCLHGGGVQGVSSYLPSAVLSLLRAAQTPSFRFL